MNSSVWDWGVRVTLEDSGGNLLLCRGTRGSKGRRRSWSNNRRKTRSRIRSRSSSTNVEAKLMDMVNFTTEQESLSQIKVSLFC